jgi:hypothetical protein
MDFAPTNKANERPEAERIARPINNQPSMGNQSNKAAHPRKMKKLIAAILAIIIVVGAGLMLFNSMRSSLAINKGEYQAVFLTNGQVYFGKLQTINNDYLVLNNIYYLQVQQSVQDGKTTTTTDQNQAQLVKLGNELHGPEDQMQISSKQVLFWENLKTDGKVAQSIAKYKG